MKKVKLRVGEREFFTTESILSSVKDSFFCGMLNPNFGKSQAAIRAKSSQSKEEKKDNAPSSSLDQDDTETTSEFFIPRDGNVFAYVLEFLTYKDIFSPVTDAGMLRKLAIDADFYLLPNLVEKVKALTGDRKEAKVPTIPIVKVASTAGCTNGSYWNWNITEVPPTATHFTVSGQTITINKNGTYHVMIRTAGAGSSNGYYMALYVNGSDVARCYNCDGNGYYISWEINEIFSFKATDRLQVYHTFTSSINSQQCNKMSIVCLES